MTITILKNVNGIKRAVAAVLAAATLDLRSRLRLRQQLRIERITQRLQRQDHQD